MGARLGGGVDEPGRDRRLGMTLALSLAARRALTEVVDSIGSAGRTMVLLDGKHDWLSAPLTLDCLGIFGPAADLDLPPVRTVIKGDGSVPVIAAASIVAKVDRDERMIDLARCTRSMVGSRMSDTEPFTTGRRSLSTDRASTIGGASACTPNRTRREVRREH